ncbi:MAG: hypothetical protein WA813_06055 [Beijerinckiaceae bacterium]
MGNNHAVHRRLAGATANENAHAVDVAEIAAVSIVERGIVQLRLLDADGRGWLVRLRLDVLDSPSASITGVVARSR